MTVWDYVGATVQDGDIVADLPLSDVKFGEVLNGHGQLSASIRIDGMSEQRRIDLIDATEPGRRAVYAAVDGQLRWGGPIWTRSYAPGQGLQITAQEWGSYFHRVLLRSDKTYTQQDQLVIARDLITTHQAVTGGNVRLAVGAETSTQLRDRTYLAGDLPVLGELLENLAGVSNGFDYAWPVELDTDGRPRGRLLLGSPTLGTTSPSVVVELPRSFVFSEDAAAMAVEAWAAGAKPEGGGAVPVASTRDPALLEAGFPLLDKVSTYSTVVDDATLQAHSAADQQAAGGALTPIRVTVGMSEILATGVRRGDQALVRLGGPRFPGSTVTSPGMISSPAGRDDVFSDVFADVFGGGSTETVVTPGTTTIVGDGFEAVMRVTAIDYDPGSQTCDLTLAPRITLGGRVPAVEDQQALLGRLIREVRQLSVSS